MTFTIGAGGEISKMAYQALERNHGAINQGVVTFPEGTEHKSDAINGWRANESTLHHWKLPDGTVLSYCSDYEDRKLYVPKQQVF